MTKAEYARCISGAFHNLASSLYQAGKFASAARFLRLAALVGARALDFYRPIVAEGKVDSSKRDTWTQLAEQMYKRWELLGGCYMKTADRQVRLLSAICAYCSHLFSQLAYEAYIEAVKAFPVTESAFVSLTDSRVMKAVLDASSTHRQLGLIIDRATFLAVNDLLLPADQVPISRHLHSPGVNPHIPELAGTLFTGAVLERQLESLEASRWKTSARAAIQHVLAALLATYTPDRHPIRRSRILVKCLEYSYYTGVEGQEAGLVTSPDNALVSVQSLAPTKVRDITYRTAYSLTHEFSA
jgi:separase